MDNNAKWERGFNIFCVIISILMLIGVLSIQLNKYNTMDELETKYKNAQQLEEMGDYWNAYNLYLELGDYNNSNIKAEMVYPKAAMNYGTMLFYSDNPMKAIPYLIDASENDIEGSTDLLMKLVQDYLETKQ